MKPGLVVIIAVAVLLLVAMLVGWRRRRRRDAGIRVPITPIVGEQQQRFRVLHVATTAHDQPLERLVAHPLGYRARGDAVVTDQGVGFEFAGEPTVFLSRECIRGAGLATWTIDRSVEKDGLAVIAWEASDGTVCDSYLRPEGAPADLARAIESIRVGPAEGEHS